MSTNIVYFPGTSAFFLHMVDTIEKAAKDIGIELYRERRFRDSVSFSIGVENVAYKVTFSVRERANGAHMDIIGTYEVGGFISDSLYTYSVHTREGDFGSSLKITANQGLVWEMFAEVKNKREVEEYFYLMAQKFTSKAEKIHNVWTTYMRAVQRSRAANQNAAP